MIRRIGLETTRALRDRQGIAAVEFALVAPAVLLITAGILEMSMMMFSTALVEGGLREASRFGITGVLPEGKTREQQIIDIISEHTIGLVDMSSATVSVHVYPTFGEVGQAEPYVDSNPANGEYDPGESYNDINANGQWDSDMGASGAGGAEDIVLYRVSYDWELMTPLIGELMGDAGTMHMNASIAVRNEPYAPPASGGGGT